jgi:16S rRNA (adenine1518-N6/adenine1519-N6)-dimethyltransferase
MTDPQTQHQIQELLARHGTEPNRRLGQNFLIDGNLMRRVVEAAELDAARDVVLEVGSGTGSLTALLSERAARVVTVETDKKLTPVLEEVVGPLGNVRVLITDALATKHTLEPRVVEAVREALDAVGPQARLKLVANLPYAIATPLVANLLLSEPRPALLVFTVQKEVADRLAAGPHSRDYGPVSLLCQAVASVERLRDLSPNVFWPKPQVHSSLMRIRVDPQRVAAAGDLELFRRVASGLFAHRRKTCLKSLETAPELTTFRGRWPELLEAAGIDPGARGDTLTLEQVRRLAHAAAEL